MLHQARAKIYLAEDRKVVETDRFRNSYIFHRDEDNELLHCGLLLACNDEVLGGGQSQQYRVDIESTVLLLPLTGSLVFEVEDQVQHCLEPGQCLIKSLSAEKSFQITNLHRDLINYLQLKLDCKDLLQHNSVVDFFSAPREGLVELMNSGFRISIGKFDGRQETQYELSKPDNKVFCFVIQGAFEVAYRLLHPRDGLCLWQLESFEIEALSNNAIILFVEGPEELTIDQ